MNRGLLFGISTVLLLGIEIVIGMFAKGWIRNYLGDVLVVILLYTLVRTVTPKLFKRFYVLPSIIFLLGMNLTSTTGTVHVISFCWMTDIPLQPQDFMKKIKKP